MQDHKPKTLQSLISVKKLQVLASLNQVFQPLKRSSTQTSALLLVAGLGLSVVIPASAASTASQITSPNQKTQLLSQQPKTVELTLVSYSVTKAAYDKIIPQFVAKWKREHNQDVKFQPSYGASGSQARAVVDGLEADVVTLSLALDVEKIEKAGLLQPGWEQKAPNEAIVTRSVAALVTRPGNPKKIRVWSDLAKPGIAVITANPKTSGVDKNVDKHGTRKVSEAFVQFLFTPEAQREFTKVGFRPVDPNVTKEVASKFSQVTKLFTVKDFGGWNTIQKKFFDDGAIFDQIQASRR